MPDSRLFADRSGFFRASEADAPAHDSRFDGWPAPASDGPPLTGDDADRLAHDFLGRLAADRPIVAHDDPLDHARENGLLLLFGSAEQERFRLLVDRMDPERAETWRELLAGGRSSEAFGPLTLEEKLDEQQVIAALAKGRRQRLVNAAAAGVVIAAIAITAVVLWPESGDDSVVGSIEFGDVIEQVGVVDYSGPPPAVDATLSGALDTPVVTATGPGEATERIVIDLPIDQLPRPPGDVVTSVFEYAGRGRVVLVGGPGWHVGLCVQVSVTSAGLRPFDTAQWSNGVDCDGLTIGRLAEATCVSDTTVVLDLVVPEGEVSLTEGGTATVDSVRVQIKRRDPAFEVLSIRGVISVAAGERVAVPRFGGVPGTAATFDFTPAGRPDRIGACTLGTVDAAPVPTPPAATPPAPAASEDSVPAAEPAPAAG